MSFKIECSTPIGELIKKSKYRPSKTEAAILEFHGLLSLTIIEQTERQAENIFFCKNRNKNSA